MAFFYVEEPQFEFYGDLNVDFLDESVDQCLANYCEDRWALRWKQALKDIDDAQAEEKLAIKNEKSGTTKQERRNARLKRREKTLGVNAAKNAVITLAVKQLQNKKEVAEYHRIRAAENKADVVRKQAKEERSERAAEKRAKIIARRLLEWNVRNAKPKLDQKAPQHSGDSTPGKTTKVPSTPVPKTPTPTLVQNTPGKTTEVLSPVSNPPTPSSVQSTPGKSIGVSSAPGSNPPTPAIVQGTPGRSVGSNTPASLQSTPGESLKSPPPGTNTPALSTGQSTPK